MLKDEDGKPYSCSSKIVVRWRLSEKLSLSFKETFYVFTPCGGDMDVRIRGDFDPHPATVLDRGEGLHPLAIRKDKKKGEYCRFCCMILVL